MVQSKEVTNLKKKLRRLQTKVASLKSNAIDDGSLELVRLRRVVSKLRTKNNALKAKIERLEERLSNADLAVVQRKRLKHKTYRLNILSDQAGRRDEAQASGQASVCKIGIGHFFCPG